MYSKFRFLTLTIIFTFCTTSLAGQLINEFGSKYSYEKMVYNGYEMDSIFVKSEQANIYYQKYKSNRAKGFLAAGIGAGAILVGYLIVTQVECRNVCLSKAIFGAGSLALGFILEIVAIGNLSSAPINFKSAMNHFNWEMSQETSSLPQSKLMIAGTTNGIGLVYQF